MRTSFFFLIAVCCGVAFCCFTAESVTAQEKTPETLQSTPVKAAEKPLFYKPFYDLVYAEYGERKMHLDLFIPQALFMPLEKETKKPVIVVVHGGGWLKGDKTKFRALAQALAQRGFVTAAIEYRLGGEAKFPAAIHDCNAAVRWLRANSEKYRIDADRIGAVGGSAGGHLVGLMATASHLKDLQGSGGNETFSSEIQAAVVMAGPMELATGPVAEKSRNQPEKSNSNQWLGKTVDEDLKLYQFASPYTHLSEKTAPMLFMTGELDLPERNALTRKKLRELGVAAELKVYHQGKHGCWNRHPWFHPMVDDIENFMRKHLKYQGGNLQIWKQVDSGVLMRKGNVLYLHVNKVPENGVLSIPRLNNEIVKVFLADNVEKELKYKPLVKTWEITIPKERRQSEKAPHVVIELKEPAHFPSIPIVVSEDENGLVLLPAHHAVTHGKLLRYEPQPHKNTVGYWANVKDWCEWHFAIDQPGRYEVEIFQGCGKGHGGSDVSLKVGEEELTFKAEDTGHFQNFKERNIGMIELHEAGMHSLQIRPKNIAKGAVMDVRWVKLHPVKKQRKK